MRGTPAPRNRSWTRAQRPLRPAAGLSRRRKVTRDGESIPITLVEQIIARIVSTIDAPVSVDFEGGYSYDNGALAENVARLLELGFIGINFEARAVQGAGLYPIAPH